jgi:GDP-L-fucose synthase
MKILVTGSSGVAGQALRAIANDYGHSFIFSTSKDCNLTDSNAVNEYFSSVKPEGVINFAAVSGGIGLSGSRHASMLRDNALININVFEASRKFNVKKLVACLTTGMYSPSAPLPLKERDIHLGEPHESNYGSSFGKRIIEPMVRGYRDEYNLDVVGLIPNGIFGPNDNFHPEQAPMLPAQILKFYNAKRSGSNVVVWGDGSPLREYTYSYDIARAFMWALENYSDSQVLNCGTNEELSIKEIVEELRKYFNLPKDSVYFDTTKPLGVIKKSVDNSQFVARSKFTYTSFKDGLRDTCEWLEKNIDTPNFRQYEKTRG